VHVGQNFGLHIFFNGVIIVTVMKRLKDEIGQKYLQFEYALQFFNRYGFFI